MDTDSLFLALSMETLDLAVKPELKQLYLHGVDVSTPKEVLYKGEGLQERANENKPRYLIENYEAYGLKHNRIVIKGYLVVITLQDYKNIWILTESFLMHNLAVDVKCLLFNPSLYNPCLEESYPM